jgi:hypothetical protein
MALLDDISNARNQLQTRVNKTVDQARLNHGVNYDNIHTLDTWDGRFATADKERIGQLDLLSKAMQDPSWTASLDREVTARKDAGFKQADYGQRQAEDKRKVGAAKGGVAGGSWDAVVQAQNAQEMARIKATVTQQVGELKAAGIQNLEEMGRQLLSKALAGGEETGAMGMQSAATADRNAADGISDRLNEQYRNLLSNTLGSFLSGTVTPAVTMGFDSAARWNDQQRNNYTDARDSGAYAGNFRDWEAANGGSRSWWGF